MKFEHFVWIPFNIALYRHPKIKDHTGWMAYRIELFKKYCLSSLLNQTAPIRIFVFFDVDTPVPLYFDGATSIYVDSNDVPNEWERCMKRHLEKDTEVLITTRMDNDDMVRNDFAERVQNEVDFRTMEVSFANPCAVNFPYGYCWKPDTGEKTEVGPECSNPFISIINDVRYENFTLFKSGHDSVSSKIKTYQVEKFGRMWVRHIHKMNESNGLGGVLVKKIDGDFGVVIP